MSLRTESSSRIVLSIVRSSFKHTLWTASCHPCCGLRQVWRTCHHVTTNLLSCDHTHIPQFEWSFFSSPVLPVSSESVQSHPKANTPLTDSVTGKQAVHLTLVSATVLVSSFRLVLYGTISLKSALYSWYTRTWEQHTLWTVQPVNLLHYSPSCPRPRRSLYFWHSPSVSRDRLVDMFGEGLLVVLFTPGTSVSRI